MNPIKIGMIGFGRMGGFYLEQMQKSGRWEVAYICDASSAPVAGGGPPAGSAGAGNRR